MTQLDLACDADISTKLLGSLESGRAQPTREMVLLLAACLDIPLRVRNLMLEAAGFDPAFQQRDFHHPALAVARRDVEIILASHDPNPAMAIDRHWIMLSANKAVASLVAGAEPALLRPPVNLLRLFLHPAGLGSRIVNLVEWRTHIIGRLRRLIATSGDTDLTDLLEEIRDYPRPPEAGRLSAKPRDVQCRDAGEDRYGIATPFQLVTIDGTLSFFGTTTQFAMPADITLSELTIEAFLPADQQTIEILRRTAPRAQTQELPAASAMGRHVAAA